MDWIAFFLFVVLFFLAIIGETVWLVRKGWASTGRATAFVLITDFLSFGVSAAVLLAFSVILLMITLGPSGRGSDAPEWLYIVIVIASLLVPPALLILSKRVMLPVLKIRSGKTAWVFSLVISMIIIGFVVIPPPALFFVILSSWK